MKVSCNEGPTSPVGPESCGDDRKIVIEALTGEKRAKSPKYGYDRNSNRQWRQNMLGSGLDELYTYDNLNRLVTMKRGTLSGTPPVITSPANQQDWTLDPTGNWNEFINQTSGSTDLDQTRTQNKVNEITAISASVGTTWATPVYDAAGNMTTMPKPSSLANSYTATYDAWNRMIQVKDGGTTIATYSYDGRNRRIKVDTGVVRHFYFTNGWQDVEERLGSLTSADQQYVWGIRYIDELVCRDRLVGGSSSSSSSSSSGGTGLNERLYACQDANFNVTSLIDTSANVAERYSYDPYGTPTFRNASWADIGASAKASTILYAGYKYDPETGLYCVRFRFVHPTAGTWITRDLIGYSQGASLYVVLKNNSNTRLDPYGLAVLIYPAPGQAKDIKRLTLQFQNDVVSALHELCPCVQIEAVDVGKGPLISGVRAQLDPELASSPDFQAQTRFCDCVQAHAAGCKLVHDLLKDPRTTSIRWSGAKQGSNLPNGQGVNWNPVWAGTGEHPGGTSLDVLAHELTHLWAYWQNQAAGNGQQPFPIDVQPNGLELWEVYAVRAENQLQDELGGIIGTGYRTEYDKKRVNNPNTPTINPCTRKECGNWYSEFLK